MSLGNNFEQEIITTCLVAPHCMNQICVNPRLFENPMGSSLPACEQFSYLYKNSFCTVLLEERGFDIWLFCKATWLLLSSCARVAKLSVTCVFFIDWKKIFLLSWFFSLNLNMSIFLFFNKKPCFNDRVTCVLDCLCYVNCSIDSRWVMTSCYCCLSCIDYCTDRCYHNSDDLCICCWCSIGQSRLTTLLSACLPWLYKVQEKNTANSGMCTYCAFLQVNKNKNYWQ